MDQNITKSFQFCRGGSKFQLRIGFGNELRVMQPLKNWDSTQAEIQAQNHAQTLAQTLAQTQAVHGLEKYKCAFVVQYNVPGSKEAPAEKYSSFHSKINHISILNLFPGVMLPSQQPIGFRQYMFINKVPSRHVFG